MHQLTPEELADAELILHHVWPLLPAEARTAFALEDGEWDLGEGVLASRYGGRAEWTFTTGGRLKNGWWVKVRSDCGQASLSSPNNEWSVLRPGWRL
jgi:hypothetical protein